MDPTFVISAINESPMNRGLDGAKWLADERNVAVNDAAGNVTLFEFHDPGIYEAHFLCHKGTGREKIDRIRKAYDFMFRQRAAGVLFGLVSVFNRKARIMARLTGAQSLGIRATEFGPCELFILTRQVWEGSKWAS